MSKTTSTPSTARRAGEDRGTAFMANLRQALEHVGDDEWLRDHSPLESLRMLGAAGAPARPPEPPALGIKALDERLAAAWRDWESRPKTGLQALLWSAAKQVKPEKDVDHRALLVLTYFQDPRPKQGDLIKQLAVGQSTYYRQLNAAVEAFERVLLSQLQPSLRLESPAARPLIGRDALLRDVLAALRAGGAVSLIGASGLGKTSLAAAMHDAWSREAAPHKPASDSGRSFWYTFRPGLTDNLQHLIFSLALFLHQRGASHLWLQLIARPADADLDAARALATIRKSLEDLGATPPLLCFDEVDLLLPGELEDAEEHPRVRAFLEGLAESPRSGAPMLLVGQRLFMQPEANQVFALERFSAADTRALLRQAGIDADDAQCAAAHATTRGNPLLVQLLVALHRVGEPVLAEPARLSSAASLDWFLTRLRRHLSDKERDVLDAACVFDAPAPAGAWRKQAQALDRLITLNLIERDALDQAIVPQVVREALYRQLPLDLRGALHIAAAEAYTAHGAHTLAAHHYMLGQQPEMAVWTWYAHREAEVRQGQAEVALRIFAAVRPAELAHEADRRALALILADLAYLRGQHEDGLAALDELRWRPGRASSARARELRARLLARRGDIDAALAEYRASLDDLAQASPAKPIALRAEMARQGLVRARDVAMARREAVLAKHDVEILLGEIEDEGGNVEQALRHFHAALELAQASGDPVRLAKANEALGVLEARRANAEAAERYLSEAGRHYAAYGHVVNAMGMTSSNIAFAYLMARRYREAIAPAERAVVFFREAGLPYELSLNEANLAEAYANLGDADQAEAHAWRAMAQEETVVRPQCLYVLAVARRLQGRYEEAERLARDAMAAAEENADPWSAAFALRALAEAQRDAGKREEARHSFVQARDAFTQLGLRDDAAGIDAEIARL